MVHPCWCVRRHPCLLASMLGFLPPAVLGPSSRPVPSLRSASIPAPRRPRSVAVAPRSCCSAKEEDPPYALCSVQENYDTLAQRKLQQAHNKNERRKERAAKYQSAHATSTKTPRSCSSASWVRRHVHVPHTQEGRSSRLWMAYHDSLAGYPCLFHPARHPAPQKYQ